MAKFPINYGEFRDTHVKNDKNKQDLEVRLILECQQVGIFVAMVEESLSLQ